jgi:general secretion pathway protein G
MCKAVVVGPRRERCARSCGFTLIELLVVFSMLALLLSIATPRYLNAVSGSKEKVRAQNLATIRDALDKFKADQGRFPSEVAELVTKQYLRAMPVDPVTDSSSWVVVPPPEGVAGGVYDVSPPVEAAAKGSPE